jgi:outer membrane protein insertion porin family
MIQALQGFRLRSIVLLVTVWMACTLSLAIEPFVIKEIRVEGLQRVEPGTVFASIPLRVNETFNDEKGSAAIRSLFGRRGRFRRHQGV